MLLRSRPECHHRAGQRCAAGCGRARARDSLVEPSCARHTRRAAGTQRWCSASRPLERASECRSACRTCRSPVCRAHDGSTSESRARAGPQPAPQRWARAVVHSGRERSQHSDHGHADEQDLGACPLRQLSFRGGGMELRGRFVGRQGAAALGPRSERTAPQPRRACRAATLITTQSDTPPSP